MTAPHSFSRPAAVAGAFYPGDASALDGAVRGYLAKASDAAGTVAPKAIVVPHAGYVYSGALAARVFAMLQPAADKINRVVLLGPCHRVPLRGLAASAATAIATPLGDVPIDMTGLEKVLKLPMVQISEESHAQEHSLEVQLPFLQVMLADFSLLPLVVGDATGGQIADVLDAVWGGPETLIVISSDLSHFLDYDGAHRIDAKTRAAIERLDPDSIGDEQACGRIPLKGLLEAARRRDMRVETVGLCNSGDTAGDRDRVVGYGGWAFFEKDTGDFENRTRRLIEQYPTDLLETAAASIRHGLDFATPLTVAPADYPPDLAENGACFVTLKHGERLRGCIGSPEAYRPLIVDVAENGYSAGFRDPRFPALRRDELTGLNLAISLLSPSAPIPFDGEADLLAQLRPGIDGLIIEDRGRRALFLPSVWEQLPDPVDFLGHLRNKAGLAADHWSATFTARRFIAAEIAATDHGGSDRLWKI